MEVLVFLTFVALQLAIKRLERMVDDDHIAAWGARLLSRHHWLVWLAHPSVCSNPAFWHGVQEYVVHFFVYSGYVLPTH